MSSDTYYRSSPPQNTGSIGPYNFGTADGHNPEIIYHLLDGQSRLTHQVPYNRLDDILRLAGPSPEQVELEEIERQEEERAILNAFGGERSSTPAPQAEQSRLGAPSYSPPSSPPPSITAAGQSIAGGEGHGPASDFDTENTESTDAADWEDSSSGDDANRPIERNLWEGPDAVNEPQIYNGLMKRLLQRTSTDLENDTDGILDRDYMHGVVAVYQPDLLVRHMKTRSGEKHTFSLQWDGPDDAPMPEGPFEVLCPNPMNVLPILSEPMALRHIYLPGWRGRHQEDKLKASEWRRGIELAVGRWRKSSAWNPFSPEIRLGDAVRILGFPDLLTFQDFIHRPKIADAFRELWDAHLQNVESQAEIPCDEAGRRPVALRIFYSRTCGGESEFDDEHPDKTDWETSSHLARFCLQVEKVCNAEHLPPIRGQLPILRMKAASSIVAWAGIELARILRTLPKQPGNREFYLGVLVGLST
ncbi:Phospholipase C, phosphatidylinositol-specific, X domain protein [Akanthomyces lecanii RCEF 1005]|uniref:Phospholipase C, phosphatidylinositol-specific, X domain protein n=1 Tax=Akanthomyces lecanii RCEF 1005 TaxID=1081108 RepID=A0A162N2L9_CORDF|nr:Phospholipase C, phosphatidylinositol-specific, X domain protein [Akanthomyces lecanii RCEF 1005]